MKKTLSCIILLLIFASGIAFSQNRAGLNKIGLALGYPAGLSYSYHLTEKDQLDFTLSSFFYNIGLSAGYLRTLFEPNINNVISLPVELGGGFDFSYGFGYYSHISVGGYADLRLEFLIKSIPHLNLFIDFAPRFQYWLGSYFHFSPGGGLGVRYAF